MKMHSAPGSDGILPMMLKRAGETAHQALHATILRCWNKGTFPEKWKKENRIFIKKPGKGDYNNPKAYRGLSLASATGKLYERIANIRLLQFMQDNSILDLYQYAYQKNKSLTQAMLHFALSILEGFKREENTVAVFIDLEGAFDNLWRKGLIFLLHKAGLRGNLLMFVSSYLFGRHARILANEYTSDWSETNIGIPQGSVIAPLLFIFFINDMTSKIPKHLSFADDLTIWLTSVNLRQLESELSPMLASIFKWCYRWRLKANTEKTDYVFFKRWFQEHQHY